MQTSTRRVNVRTDYQAGPNVSATYEDQSSLFGRNVSGGFSLPETASADEVFAAADALQEFIDSKGWRRVE